MHAIALGLVNANVKNLVEGCTNFLTELNYPQKRVLRDLNMFNNKALGRIGECCRW